jgi:hypothetical protein
MSVAAVIATVAAALHAEPIDDYLKSLRGFSGPTDRTALIWIEPLDYVQSECDRLNAPSLLEDSSAYQACKEAEAATARERALRELGLDPE